jgi:hypothetical protein
MSLADELLADLGGDVGADDDGDYAMVQEITGEEPMDTGDQSEDRVFRVARLIQSPEVHSYHVSSMHKYFENINLFFQLIEVMEKINNRKTTPDRSQGDQNIGRLVFRTTRNV